MPNHSNCAVAVCPNTGRNATGRTMSYYQFPKDPTLCHQWKMKCNREDSINEKYARICSVHFGPNDFERNLQYELLGITPRFKKLKKDAVPTLHLHKCIKPPEQSQDTTQTADAALESTSPQTSERQTRLERRRIRSSALERLANISPIKRKYDQATNTDIVDPEKVAMRDEIKTLEKRLKMMERNCARILQSKEELKKELQKCQRQLLQSKSLTSNAKQKLRARDRNVGQHGMRTATSNDEWLQKHSGDIAKAVSNIFTSRQLRHLVKNSVAHASKGKKKKTVHWEVEDIQSALALRAVTRRGYQYLRSKGYPLPCLSTLRNWTKNFHCNPGILNNVLNLLRTRCANFNVHQKLCVLSFDEMNVDSRYCYDQSTDKILGSFSNVQVVMVRGLIQNWKQPVYYDFDVSMTAALLQDIIKSVEAAGLMVVAVVSDMGAKNKKVWKELGVSFRRTFFKNPVDSSRNIWAFCDVPHLLKLLRNHFLDSGLRLPDGTIIGKELIETLMAKETSELKLAFHLRPHHLTVSGRDRQNVRTAAQLFSNRTAKALEYMFGKTNATNFFATVNNAFDVLNSYVPIHKKELKSAFGKDLAKQNDVLNDFKQAIYRLRVGKNKNMLPFQMGFITSIESLRGLHKDLQSIGTNYILTARLNQDCLENFFSRIRFVGATYDNPLPSDVRNRIRLLILTSGTADICISKGAAVETDKGSKTTSQNGGKTNTAQDSDATTNSGQESFATIDDDLESFITNELFIGLTDSSSERSNYTNAFVDDGNSIVIGDDQDTAVLCEDVDSSNRDCSLEALRYLAGYIAFRCKRVQRSLGTPTGHLPVPDGNTHNWIHFLSEGGLQVPSKEWMDIVKEFEVNFAVYHGKEVCKHDHVLQTLCGLLHKKFPELHHSVIELYVRTRTFIRIRFLNAHLKEKRQHKASVKKKMQFASSAH